MKCPACGADVADDKDRFCSQCGSRLPDANGAPAPEPRVEPAPEPAAAPSVEVAPALAAEAAVAEIPEPGEPAAAEEPDAGGCPACGFVNRPGARFCMACGQPLPAEPPPVPEAEAPLEPEAEAPVVSAVEAVLESEVEVVPAPELEAASEPEIEPQAVPEPDAPAVPAAVVDPEPVAVHAGPDEAGVAGQEPEVVPCPRCGSQNRPGARFCLTCGQALGAASQPAAAPVAILTEEEKVPVRPAPDEAPVDARPEPKAGDLAETAPLAPAAPVQAPPEPVAAEAAAYEAKPDAESTRTPVPAPAPLSLKTVVGGRYAILDVLPAPDEGTNLYAAADLQRCWSCEQPVADPSQPFCLECGADVTEPPAGHRVHLAEVLAPEGGEAPPEGALVEGGRLYVLVPREAEPEHAPFPQGVRLAVGQASDAGQVRDLDEDSVLALTLTGLYDSKAGPTVGLYVVADGIGGHEGGEWASRLAAQIITRELMASIVHPLITEDVELPLLEESVLDHVRRAVTTANQQIFKVRTERGSDMGTTVTMALVLDDRAYIANVGDSRTYVWGQDGLDQVTTDHSLVASLIATGAAEPGEIYTHPQRNAIYRSLGDKTSVEVDVFSRHLAPGNLLVLCCDGVWEMIHDEGLEELLLQGLPPQATCDEAVRRANLAGGEDNISVLVVRLESNGG